MLLNDVCKDKDLVERLTGGKTKILLAISTLNAATTQNKSQDFQIQYLKCRAEMLQALVQLVDTCRSLRTSPPPAIAVTQAKQMHDDLQRCGRITHLLRKCVKDFDRVSQMYRYKNINFFYSVSPFHFCF